MHEAIMDVIGHTTYIKPELPDLSPIPHVVEYIKYRNGLPDSEDESNGPLADETSSLSPRHPGSQAHDACEVNATFSKNNKERRDREWNLAHAK